MSWSITSDERNRVALPVSITNDYYSNYMNDTNSIVMFGQAHNISFTGDTPYEMVH